MTRMTLSRTAQQNSTVKTKTQPSFSSILFRGIGADAMVYKHNVTMLKVLTLLQLGQLESLLDVEDAIRQTLVREELGTCIPDGNWYVVHERYNNVKLYVVDVLSVFTGKAVCEAIASKLWLGLEGVVELVAVDLLTTVKPLLLLART